MPVLSGDKFGRGNAFILGLVREHRAGVTSPIAQTPGTFVLEVMTDLDLAALIGFDTGIASSASPSILGLRPIDTSTTSASSVSLSPPSAGSMVSVAFLPLTVQPVTLVPVLDIKALLLEHARAVLADIAVHAGQDLVEIFHDGDFRAEPQPDAAQLEPDHAAADHDQMSRHFRQFERAGAESTTTCLSLSISTPGNGVTEEPVAIRTFFAVYALVANIDRVGVFKRTMALDPVDLVLLEQKFDPAGQFRNRFELLGQHLLRGRAWHRSA